MKIRSVEVNRIFESPRLLSIASFSFLFAYLLSFLFEGQVLYSTMDAFDTYSNIYIILTIMAHFLGLFSAGYFITSHNRARLIMIYGMVVCIVATLPFFFSPSSLWLVGLVTAALSAGFAVSSWGYFLKEFTRKKERIKSCADVLIFSNIIMISINVVAINISHTIGLLFSISCLFIGGLLAWLLPSKGEDFASSNESKKLSINNIKKPVLMLFLFIAIITINSGLMYQVVNPAFEQLKSLVNWYWAVPYIFALILMRNLSVKSKLRGPFFLYLGMAMIVAAFINFMLLGRGPRDYLIVNTLMLGAFGIFDLFWWSIIGEMLDYSHNPAKIFGFGLSANVLGVLLGDMLGVATKSLHITEAETAVIALTVVCITLAILPALNRQLVLLLKSHVYLKAYEGMEKNQQEEIIYQTKAIEALTEREKEVLLLVLAGKSNKEIASDLYITESTVKTHVRNIFSKYDVNSRAELISILLMNQS